MVPLDGTPAAARALLHAIEIARRAQAKLHLVTVAVQAPITVQRIRPEDELHRQARDYLDEMAERAREGGVADVDVAVLKGEIAEALTRYRAKVDADLTVLATHGHGPVRRAWLGSIADRFLRSTVAPVLVVRPEVAENTTRAADVEFRRVLVTVDGSPFSERVLDPALELGALFEAEFTLLHLVEFPHAFQSIYLPDVVEANREIVDEREKAARAELEELRGRIGGDGATNVALEVDVVTRVVDGILDHAREGGFDLIAMASHGHGGIKRLALGSVADKVVRGADCPVLVVHPPDE